MPEPDDPLRMDWAESIYSLAFRGRTFAVSPIGSERPSWLLESFVLEAELRDDWWKIGDGDMVVDVGAGFGSYTLTALAAGAALVVAVEPGRGEFFDLCTNLALNGWLGRCVPLNFLVGEAEFEAVRAYDSGTHSMIVGDPDSKEWRISTSVDRMVERMGLSRVDWLKVDVEGAEEAVLRGAAGTLRDRRPKLIVECHEGYVPGVGGKVRELLMPLGYVESAKAANGTSNGFWSLWVPEG